MCIRDSFNSFRNLLSTHSVFVSEVFLTPHNTRISIIQSYLYLSCSARQLAQYFWDSTSKPTYNICLLYTSLRFDDTNPTKEDVEYVEAIKEEIQWLGYQWGNEYYASDYFQQLWAVSYTHLTIYFCDYAVLVLLASGTFYDVSVFEAYFLSLIHI